MIDLAIFKAICCDSAPETVSSISLVAPSPSRAISLANCIALFVKAASNFSVSIRPASPLARMTTVSLVEVSESIEIRLKDLLTTLSSIARSSSELNLASVTK